MATYRRLDFETLREALLFVAAGGGTVVDKVDTESYPNIEGFDTPWGGAYGPCFKLARLANGSYFGVEAYSNGPLSEVTPDEDFGVRVFGLVEG